MHNHHIGIMLELLWPLRRHVDVFAGAQRFAQESGNWECEIDEFHWDDVGSRSRLAGYDGLIARSNGELAQLARRANVPMVNVWFNSPATECCYGVFPDFGEVGRVAAEHVLEQGFQQFACLSATGDMAQQNMISAFHSKTCEEGGTCSCMSIVADYCDSSKTWSQFHKKLDAWIASWKPPVAIFVACCDVTIRYVLHACQRNGLSIPDDVALIGSTNEPTIGDIPPSLSAVNVSYEQVGYQAAEMLEEILQGRTPPLHRLVLPTGVIVGDSTRTMAGVELGCEDEKHVAIRAGGQRSSLASKTQSSTPAR